MDGRNNFVQHTLYEVIRYQGDVEDLRFLIRKMEIRDLSEIQDALDRYYPDEVIQAKNIPLLKSLVEAHDE